MSLDAKGAAALALHRFGFGPRAGSIAAIASDPRGAVLAELEQAGIGQVTSPDLMSGAEASRAVFEFNSERNAKQKMARQQREAEKARAAEAGQDAMADAPA